MLKVLCAAALLAVALTATAWGASKITGGQIKDGTVQGRDIRNNSLTLKDISNRSERALRAPGPVTGPSDPGVSRVTGPKGVQAPAGSPDGAAVGSSTATCPDGSVVVGGGFVSDSIMNEVNYAVADQTTYSVIAVNYYNGVNGITAQAICARGSVAGSPRSAAHVKRRVEQVRGAVAAHQSQEPSAETR